MGREGKSVRHRNGNAKKTAPTARESVAIQNWFLLISGEELLPVEKNEMVSPTLWYIVEGDQKGGRSSCYFRLTLCRNARLLERGNGESLLQIGNQVSRVFDADGNSHQVAG